MKKLLLLASLSCIVLAVKAQDFKKIQASVLLKQYEAAKVSIDQIAADPKAQDKAETYLWKAKIYAALYKDDALRAKYPSSEQTADSAFKKYRQLEPDMKTLVGDGLQDLVFDIYLTSFNFGIKTFNNKDWDSAFYYFKYATEYSDVIFQNKWSSKIAPFDTTSILYTGYSAQNDKKALDAAYYYGRLIDSGVVGKDYLNIYQYVLLAYTDAKDQAKFEKYLAISKKAYPEENWGDYETNYMQKAMTLNEKEALYEKEDAAGTLTDIQYMVFGEYFTNIPKEEKDALDSTKQAFYQSKGLEAFKKAFAKNPQNGIAAFNVGVIMYGNYSAIDDQVRATYKSLQALNMRKAKMSPADYKTEYTAIKAKRADFEKPELAAVDESLEWMLKCYNVLKDKADKSHNDKIVYAKSIDFIANLYQFKRDNIKSKDPKLFNQYDALFKKFDAAHISDY